MKFNPLYSLVSGIKWIIVHVIIDMIVGLRPLFGPACCKFSVSCTEFAILKLKEESLGQALWQITKRLASCHPFYRPKQ
jgi:putative component of membrane protein insertase Oxa1/YidC/SpoIIIJ protein YidD